MLNEVEQLIKMAKIAVERIDSGLALGERLDVSPLRQAINEAEIVLPELECNDKLKAQLKLADKNYLKLKSEFDSRVSKILKSIEGLDPVVAVMSDTGMSGFPIIKSLSETTNWKNLRDKYPEIKGE